MVWYSYISAHSKIISFCFFWFLRFLSFLYLVLSGKWILWVCFWCLNVIYFNFWSYMPKKWRDYIMHVNLTEYNNKNVNTWILEIQCTCICSIPSWVLLSLIIVWVMLVAKPWDLTPDLALHFYLKLGCYSRSN